MYLSLFSQAPQLLQLSAPLYMYKSLYSLQPLQLSQPSVLVEVSLLIATTANNSTVCTCLKLSSTRNPYLLQPSCIIVRVQVHLLSATTATVFVSVRKKGLSTLDATNATQFQPHVPLFVYKSPYVSKKSDWNYCNYRNSL